jgi:heme A synthase
MSNSMLAPVNSFHSVWGYIAISFSGLIGVWGLLRRRNEPTRMFAWSVGISFAALLVQVISGLIMYSGGTEPGNQHVFYGVLIAVTLSFVYIYRPQFRKRPMLYYGLVLLFLMGLAIRGIQTFGVDF